MGKKNDLRLKITSSEVGMAHLGIHRSDLSIYKVKFPFHLTDVPFVYHGQLQSFFFFFFFCKSDFLDHCPSSSFSNLPILPRIVLLSTLDLITITTTTTNEAKMVFRKMRLFKRVNNMNGMSIPPSFVNMY